MLNGVLSFRSITLDSAQNALGRIAITLAQTLNAQHQSGMDLNGDMGVISLRYPHQNNFSIKQ